MTKTLLLPGLDGSSASHWQRWWAAIDPNALIVEQQNWASPTHEAWEAELAGAILSHPNCVLVGHSLGAVLAARILTRWPQLRVSAALLVAPANPDHSPRLASFAGLPDRPLGVPTTLVASRDDPWMSFGQSRHLANATRTQTELPFGGAAMNRVSTPPVEMAKDAPMSVRVGAPVPSLATSCQRVWVPRWNAMPMQLMAAASIRVVASAAVDP